jgi:hypothetical protein
MKQLAREIYDKAIEYSITPKHEIIGDITVKTLELQKMLERMMPEKPEGFV